LKQILYANIIITRAGKKRAKIQIMCVCGGEVPRNQLLFSNPVRRFHEHPHSVHRSKYDHRTAMYYYYYYYIVQSLGFFIAHYSIRFWKTIFSCANNKHVGELITTSNPNTSIIDVCVCVCVCVGLGIHVNM